VEVWIENSSRDERMPYRFARERQDYSDFAGGQVFVTAPGQTGFPVRLASELFQRCLAIRGSAGFDSPCALYDPCCGSAYLLSTLAFLHGREIRRIIGSDVDRDALGLARRNLALTTPEGLAARIAELQRLHQLYGKASHAAALDSARRLQRLLAATGAEHGMRSELFAADALRKTELAARLKHIRVDVVLTDVPYGQLSSWQAAAAGANREADPVTQMLEALRPVLSAQAVVAIATDKQQKAAHPAYARCDRFQVGKRRIVFLRPVPRTLEEAA
jgi:hypothetical protein